MIFKKFFEKFKDKKGEMPFDLLWRLFFVSTLVILALIFIINFILI